MKKFLVVMLLCFISIPIFYGQLGQGSVNTDNKVSQLAQDNVNKDNKVSQLEQNQVVDEDKSEQSVELIKDKEKIKFIDIIIYATLILSVSFNIFLILKFKSSDKRNYYNKQNNSNDKAYYENLSKVNEKLQSDIKLLNDQITSLKNENNKPGGMQFSKEDENFIEDEKASTIELAVNNEIKSTKRFYLPSPFEDRRFAVEDESETQVSTSLYVVDFNPKSNKGTLKLIETADLSRALNSPNTYLETACEYQNPFNSNAHGITVIDKGEVVLDGQDWVVVNKIRIKFI